MVVCIYYLFHVTLISMKSTRVNNFENNHFVIPIIMFSNQNLTTYSYCEQERFQ